MTSKPHDALFKSTFRDPEAATELFKLHLSPAVVSRIVWETLTLMPDSFVDPCEAERRTDLLFSAQMRSSTADSTDPSDTVTALFYLLCEHQSRSDLGMALRIASPVVRILEQHTPKRIGERLPLVFPLVVSRAAGGWTAPTVLHDLFDPHPSEFDHPEVQLNLRYYVEDLSHLSDAVLRGKALSALVTIVLAVQRDAHDEIALLEHPELWADVWDAALHSANGISAVVGVLRYLADRMPRVNFERFRDSLFDKVAASDEREAAVNETMSWTEHYIHEGELKGQRQGQISLLERMLEGKFGPLADEARRKLHAADEPALDRYAERILSAQTVDDVFAEPT